MDLFNDRAQVTRSAAPAAEMLGDSKTFPEIPPFLKDEMAAICETRRPLSRLHRICAWDGFVRGRMGMARSRRFRVRTCVRRESGRFLPARFRLSRGTLRRTLGDSQESGFGVLAGAAGDSRTGYVRQKEVDFEFQCGSYLALMWG